MVSPKETNDSSRVNDADTSEAAILQMRPKRTVALIAKAKIKELPKVSDFATHKLEDAAKSEDNANDTISSLPAKDKKVPASPATTNPRQKSAAAGSPKRKADKTEETDIDDIAASSSNQPTLPQAKRQKSPTPTDAPNKSDDSDAGPSQPRDATSIWNSVRGQTAAEKRDLRKQQKERAEKMEAQRKVEKQAEEKAKVQNEKMKFMVPSSDEARDGSLTDEEEAEAYARGLGAKIDVMADVYQSNGRDGLITYKNQDQLMRRILAVDAPRCCATRSSRRKPQSTKTKVGNSWPDMDMVNEDDESPPYVRKPHHPKTSYKKETVDDEEDEGEESPPHLRKPQRGRPKNGDKAPDIQIDEDDEESPHKRTSRRLRKPNARAKATVVEVEDDEDEVEKSPPRNRRVSRGRQPKAAKAKARVSEDEDMEDVVEKSPPRTRAPRSRPPRRSQAKAKVVESEDEDMEDVVDKSPPRIRGDHRAAVDKRPKAKIGDPPRIDPYDEAALYTSYARLSLNAANKTLEKARMGEGMGHRKHK